MIVKMTTSKGSIRLSLNPDKAPKTVANFVDYCRDGFYDGTIFHRVISGFMIQGGGMEPGMGEKATNAPIENEANNGLQNRAGAIAMARTMDPHSATAQFFINTNNNGFLDYPGQDGWGYCVFGEVIEGMDVVQTIEKSATASRGFHDDVPVEDILIEKVELEEGE